MHYSNKEGFMWGHHFALSHVMGLSHSSEQDKADAAAIRAQITGASQKPRATICFFSLRMWDSI
jgi:hypothetical protein